MGTDLPPIDRETFARYFAGYHPDGVDTLAVEMLFSHYELLRAWNRRLSLVGPGTVSEVLDRHYGESLAALPALRAEDRTLVDIGTGGGFPGLVLAMVRRDLDVVLLEPKQRKWSFLRAAIRGAERLRQAREPDSAIWSCVCLDARIGPQLPAGLPAVIDVVTSRAVGVSSALLEPVADHSRNARFLLWRGEERLTVEGFDAGPTIAIRGSTHRQIVTLVARRAKTARPPTSEARDLHGDPSDAPH